jgi:hypothetical protein
MLFGAVDIVPGQDSKLCVFRDLSESGARIELCDEAQLPSTVFLRFPNASGTMPARVVWRDDYSFGIEFSPREAMADARLDRVAS